MSVKKKERKKKKTDEKKKRDVTIFNRKQTHLHSNSLKYLGMIKLMNEKGRRLFKKCINDQ